MPTWAINSSGKCSVHVLSLVSVLWDILVLPRRLCVSFLAGFLFGPTLYYVVLLYTGASMAFYIINVLNNNLDSPAAAASSKHNYLVIAVGLMQILLMWWLGVTPSSLQ